MEDEFESAIRGLRETGASVESRDLVELIARHGSEEGAILSRYEQLVHREPAPEIRYLVGLILEDERRHHQMLGELANTIAWGWSRWSPDRSVPELTVDKASSDRSDLVDATKDLIRAEERDRAELQRLRKRLRPYADTTLWSLIVDTLVLDTEKHLRILKFILSHTTT